MFKNSPYDPSIIQTSLRDYYSAAKLKSKLILNHTGILETICWILSLKILDYMISSIKSAYQYHNSIKSSSIGF